MRFKDLRGAILSLLLLIMDIALIINGLILKNKMKLVFGVLVIPIIAVGYLRQFYIYVHSDCMLVHHFIGILSMPVLLQFKEIENIECINDKKIMIYANKRKYAVYCFKANDKFLSIKRKWDEYNETN